MARVVKGAEARRAEILQVAQGLFMERGYAGTSIQEIIEAVGIAKGTFYHHFRSKSELLDALSKELTAHGMLLALPIVEDPSLPAVEKLNQLFFQIGAWKTTQRELLVQMLTAIRQPENVLLRQRMESESVSLFVPLVAQIIEQGVKEGVFSVFSVEQAAHILFAISLATSNALGDLVLAEEQGGALERAECMVRANHQAVARILGAEEGTVRLMDEAVVRPWFSSEPCG
ncbi:MAG: TetR/AcrR family transcriptional regulator [Deltaproteobacteria bacterium]|nr:TetR/AcrR family transcriptional regulator [Deltaproteobacteria bacterium]